MLRSLGCCAWETSRETGDRAYRASPLFFAVNAFLFRQAPPVVRRSRCRKGFALRRPGVAAAAADVRRAADGAGGSGCNGSRGSAATARASAALGAVLSAPRPPLVWLRKLCTDAVPGAGTGAAGEQPAASAGVRERLAASGGASSSSTEKASTTSLS